MKQFGCPQYKHALVKSLLCPSERVILAQPSCMGLSAAENGDGVDGSPRESTGRPLEFDDKMGGKEHTPSFPEMIISACGERTQSHLEQPTRPSAPAQPLDVDLLERGVIPTAISSQNGELDGIIFCLQMLTTHF